MAILDDEQLRALLDDSKRLARVLKRAFPSWDDDRDGDHEEIFEARREELRHTHERAFERIRPIAPKKAERSELDAARLATTGRHTLYALHASHGRVKPFASKWVGHCQSVRVTLPATPADAETIWTHLGAVEPTDHLAFSVEQIVEGYAKTFGTTPTVGRVDLITGARLIGRFSPISIYLALASASDSVPIFYVLESGSAQGKPEVLYFAPSMGVAIHQQAGFSFTPFACKTNWYSGVLTMSSDGTEPTNITISIAQEQDGERHYLTLDVAYTVSEPAEVILPVALQAEAAMRVFAIAQGMGCELETWERALGDCARVSFEWETKPPIRGSGDGYSGCSSSS
ncbi:hypothetical protein ACNOYE_36280 [Nannocystaceae bacterium ST9]